MALYHIRITQNNGFIWENNVRYTLKYIEKIILSDIDNIKTVNLYRINIKEGD